MVARKSRRISRRAFTKGFAAAGGVLTLPAFAQSRSLGDDLPVPPSDRIVMGAIGAGGRGQSNLKRFLREKDVQIVAVCDVDAKRAAEGKQIVDEFYGNQDCKAYSNYLDLLRQLGIEAVCIATPDHWHAIACVNAAREGKDIYCEKPLSNSVGEGRAICNAVNRYGRILQTGSHERSTESIRFACELIRNGRLGELTQITVNLPTDQAHHDQVRAAREVPPPSPVPDDFDYYRWLGHTPVVPYIPQRVHFWWRFNLAYGGGEMTDRGAHVIDLVQLATGNDYTGPVLFDARGSHNTTGLYDAFMDYQFTNVYASGLKMIGGNQGPRGIKFEGKEGSIFIHVHGGKLEASNPVLLDPNSVSITNPIGRSPGHHRNFLDCVRSRQTPMADHEVGHRTATICHLNNLSMLLGRPLEWNPITEQVIGDDEANSLLMPRMRYPFTLTT